MEPLLTEQNVADTYHIAKETLQQWRHHRRYKLPFIKIGRLVRYRQSDVEAFVASRTVTDIEPRHFVQARKSRKARVSAVKAASHSRKSKAKRSSR
jgi:predicted DNA-binding transcriptional regulator AlpA